MPELPEVEVTRQALSPHVTGRIWVGAVIRESRLRHPVPSALASPEPQQVLQVRRRGKYLVLEMSHGALIIHLGMSGTLRYLIQSVPAQRHEHVDLLFADGSLVRYRDPRRFGALLWVPRPAEAPQTSFWQTHPCFSRMGREPLEAGFDGAWFHRATRGLKVAIKPLLLEGRLVVGAGNIYACESLFLAGIDPRRAAGRIGMERYHRLAQAVRQVLEQAIRAGGSTLRDFVGVTGEGGYFQQQHQVYGRTGQPCVRCATPIRQIRQGQRSTWYCPRCQRN
ncbi:bifunctional DNA-formamidopyrimidine glycosylase/DNA-(apurinic or apyrimidinic site) lyase [Ferrovum sp.]|uniref:bifunctional DNA-formamidopyrimidine glycosylase/DNA-(apurinic or apyrimidinic site) lyase n=1 Tax=Ferrovum sp. TaxID=2609467 RepID=UPI00263889CE|nr:bifunctional DNA-formamidopyrimidine glycosylase/DNA-(apurinic or apyrimidinic site) lyase [Ferrovum sp.]